MPTVNPQPHTQRNFVSRRQSTHPSLQVKHTSNLETGGSHRHPYWTTMCVPRSFASRLQLAINCHVMVHLQYTDGGVRDRERRWRIQGAFRVALIGCTCPPECELVHDIQQKQIGRVLVTNASGHNSPIMFLMAKGSLWMSTLRMDH